MARRTVIEKEKINNFEKSWKIKTNKAKLKIVPLAIKKKNNIIIEGTRIEYSPHGKVLGLSIGNQEIAKHIEETITKIRTALNNIYRFRSLPPRIKIYLIKAYIISILQCPPVP